MTDTERIQVSRIVEVPIERIFALLATPSQHPRLDGSGTLRTARTDAEITEVGEVFVMDLHAEDLGDYQSQVTTYERGRAIGWSPGPVGQEPFGHTYTYTLEPVGRERTRVTQTYDWSAVTDERLRGQLPRVSRQELAQSLKLLADVLRPRTKSGSTV